MIIYMTINKNVIHMKLYIILTLKIKPFIAKKGQINKY